MNITTTRSVLCVAPLAALVLADLTACGADTGGGGTDGMTDSMGGGTDSMGGDGDGDGDSAGDGDGDGDDGGMNYPAVPGTFVAVGDGGRRAWSDDGQTWEVIVGSGGFSGQNDDDVPDQLIDVCAGDGYVLAVGGGGTQHDGNTMIMRSTDGASWDEDLVAVEDQQVQLFGCAIGDGVAVAVGRRSRVYLSTDQGQTWTMAKQFHNNGNAVLHDAAITDDGTIIAVGRADPSDEESNRLPAIVHSTDGGTTWARHIFAETDPEPTHVATGNGTTVVLAGDTCLHSADLNTWESCSLPVVAPQGVIHFNDRFLVWGDDYFAFSEDGISWDITQMVFGGMPTEVAHGEGIYVGVQWGRYGWADNPAEWTYEMDFTNPLVSVAFLPD